MLIHSLMLALTGRDNLWDPPDGTQPATGQDPKRLGTQDGYPLKWYEVLAIILCVVGFTGFVSLFFYWRSCKKLDDPESLRPFSAAASRSASGNSRSYGSSRPYSGTLGPFQGPLRSPSNGMRRFPVRPHIREDQQPTNSLGIFEGVELGTRLDSTSTIDSRLATSMNKPVPPPPSYTPRDRQERVQGSARHAICFQPDNADGNPRGWSLLPEERPLPSEPLFFSPLLLTFLGTALLTRHTPLSSARAQPIPHSACWHALGSQSDLFVTTALGPGFTTNDLRLLLTVTAHGLRFLVHDIHMSSHVWAAILALHT